MTTVNRRVLACNTSHPREKQAQDKNKLNSSGGSYITAYVSTVTFTREEMNDAFARARVQERTTYSGS